METIYSITSDKGDKVYIGRTKQALYLRKAVHKYNHKNTRHCSSQVLFDEYGFENCIFTVLEECQKEIGSERERYYIEHIPNVINIRIPGRNQIGWYHDHKNTEKLQEYRRTYAEKYKERKKELNKANYQAKKDALQ